MKRQFKIMIVFILLIMAVPFCAYIKADKLPGPVPGKSSAPAKSKALNTADGELTVWDHNAGKTFTISMKEYIKGVVFAEMPVSFEKEALKAQAVIAHTYTLRVMANEQKSPSEDLKGAMISTDSSRHQAYLSEEAAKEKFGENYDSYYKKVSECVEPVLSEVLTYQNEPIIAAFHAISSGSTEDAKNVWGEEVPYLVKTESEGDLLSPGFENALTLTVDEVKNILNKNYPDIAYTDDKASWFAVAESTPSEYVKTVNVLNKQLTGQEVRTLFGLKSSNFTISFADEKFTFTTKGYGHGVGMSQYGADYMARQGKNYKEILSHYYPDTMLTTLQS